MVIIINTKIIKINCPICDEELLIEIDENFNVVSVIQNNIEISENEINNFLKENGIEFG